MCPFVGISFFNCPCIITGRKLIISEKLLSSYCTILNKMQYKVKKLQARLNNDIYCHPAWSTPLGIEFKFITLPTRGFL